MISGISNYYSSPYSYGYTSNTGMYVGYSASRPMRVSPVNRIYLDYLSCSDDKTYPSEKNEYQTGKNKKYAGVLKENKAYVSGEATVTHKKYQEDNPYERNRRNMESTLLIGQNIDFAA